jgi:HEAT repeat protein
VVGRPHEQRGDEQDADQSDQSEDTAPGWFTSSVGDDPDTVARQAREAVLAGYERDDRAIAAALSSREPLVRARALGAAARSGRLDTPARLAALSDPEPLVRRRACAIEVRMPSRDPRVVAALVLLLDDPDPLAVAGAATALGEADAPSSATALEATAKDHPDPRCREAAIAALGALGTPGSLRVVLAALHDKPAVRRRAVVALAAFQGPDVERALRDALEDRDWQVREIAAALRVSSPEASSPED